MVMSTVSPNRISQLREDLRRPFDDFNDKVVEGALKPDVITLLRHRLNEGLSMIEPKTQELLNRVEVLNSQGMNPESKNLDVPAFLKTISSLFIAGGFALLAVDNRKQDQTSDYLYPAIALTGFGQVMDLALYLHGRSVDKAIKEREGYKDLLKCANDAKILDRLLAEFEKPSQQEPEEAEKSVRESLTLYTQLLDQQDRETPESSEKRGQVYFRFICTLVHRLPEIDPLRQELANLSALLTSENSISVSRSERIQDREPISTGRTHEETYSVGQHEPSEDFEIAARRFAEEVGRRFSCHINFNSIRQKTTPNDSVRQSAVEVHGDSEKDISQLTDVEK